MRRIYYRDAYGRTACARQRTDGRWALMFGDRVTFHASSSAAKAHLNSGHGGYWTVVREVG